jgi:hypothetical protein
MIEETNETENTEKEEVHKEVTEEANPLDKAKEVLSALKAENERMEQNLERSERLAAADLLGGGGNAGQIPKTETPEDKIDREARAIIESTGLNF